MSDPESYARVPKEKVLAVCNRHTYLTLVAVCINNTINNLMRRYNSEKTYTRWQHFWRDTKHRKATTNDFVSWLKVVINDYENADDIGAHYNSTLSKCRDSNTYRIFIAETMNAAENTMDVVLMCTSDLTIFRNIQEKMKEPSSSTATDSFREEVTTLLTKYIS